MDGMKHEIYIPGPLPGENDMIAAAKVKLKSKGRKKHTGTMYDLMKKEWTVRCARVFNSQDMPKFEYIYLDFLWCEPNRKRDKDNICAAKKFVIDGLVSCLLPSDDPKIKIHKFLDNDGWKQIDGFRDHFMINKDMPGVIVTIKEIL